MYITLSVKELAIGLVLLALVILILYIAMFFKNLIATLKHTNDILVDVKSMSSVAEKRTHDVDNFIDNVVDNVSNATAEDGIVKQIASIATAFNNILKIVGLKKND